MAKVTNLQLLMAAVVVVALSAVNFALPTSTDPTATLLLAIGATVLVIVTFRILQAPLQFRTRAWLQQPVSDRLGQRVINTVVVAWLCVITATVAAIAVVLHRSSSLLVALVVLIYVGAAVAGRAIQKKYRSTNLLPYAMAFTGALVIAACVFRLAPG